MESNNIEGIKKHNTETNDKAYSDSDLKILEKLGLNINDIKNKEK